MSKLRTVVSLSVYPFLLSLPIAAATCESLASLKLPNTSLAAETVAAGTFMPPGELPGPADLAVYKTLPAFCRVQGTIRPSADSHIEFEVWLPSAGWNGKYMGTGNYDLAGYINYAHEAPLGNNPGLAYLRAGYATSSTDTGHRITGPDSQWAMGHPEKIVDWGYRGIHETAEKSKAIISAFYGNAPKHSYFSGCSNGGRQGLMETQRFPADYDGIISGAPAISITHLSAALWTNAQSIEADPARKIRPQKFPAVQSAILAACDSLDGLKDGLIDDPRKCHFDPAALLCQGPETDACLTQPQIEVLKKLYGGTRTSTGELIYPGNLPGADWRFWFAMPARILKNRGAYLIYQNPDWDYHSFNVDSEVKIADGTIGPIVNATNPNLTVFQKPRRKADSLPGLGRSQRGSRRHAQLLREGCGGNRPERRRRFHPALSGPRHVALWRRSRTQ